MMHSLWLNGVGGDVAKPAGWGQPLNPVHGGNLFSFTSRYVFRTNTSLNEVNDIVPNHHDSPVSYVKGDRQ